MGDREKSGRDLWSQPSPDSKTVGSSCLSFLSDEIAILFVLHIAMPLRQCLAQLIIKTHSTNVYMRSDEIVWSINSKWVWGCRSSENNTLKWQPQKGLETCSPVPCPFPYPSSGKPEKPASLFHKGEQRSQNAFCLKGLEVLLWLPTFCFLEKLIKKLSALLRAHHETPPPSRYPVP